MALLSVKKQEQITEKYQEQLEKQRQEFDEELKKYKMELLDTKEYEEGLHKMDNKRFWAYIALFILTFSFYGMILVYISKEGLI